MFVEIELSEHDYEQFQKEFKVFEKTKQNIYISKILGKVSKACLHRTKSERNLQILDLKEQNLTYEAIGNKFGISKERVRQIYLRERRRRDYANELYEKKKSSRHDFYICLERACVLLDREPYLATRAYNSLARAGIIKHLEEDNVTLDFYEDAYLLNIRGFGVSLLDICRKANEIYLAENSMKDASQEVLQLAT